MKPTYMDLYEKLYNRYGAQKWWPADSDFEMMIGAILIQNTSWKNVDLAFEKLRPYLEPEKMAEMDIDELAQLIRSSGFFNIKAKRIKSFLKWFEGYDYDLENARQVDGKELRNELIGIHGIGRETADVILLYALDYPVFVVDAYAQRIFNRVGYELPSSYDAFRKEIEKELPDDLQVYNEYHALLVEHAKVHCKSKPICERCPLEDVCEKRVE
ncbi:endonuclease III domain-containing protein [Halalkalibacillus halophilus]|uniref:endonuclease III domain-containing protein n=1 Tax=Halalkalibacillus halophilus TaxID=392827 RepID=UPI0003FB4B85|nr:endonuclease III domain-containing protein [Halalkalibacillus halophilus]